MIIPIALILKLLISNAKVFDAAEVHATVRGTPDRFHGKSPDNRRQLTRRKLLCDDPFPAYRMNDNCWSPAHWTSLRVAGAEAFSVTASGEVEALRVI